jgi:hypothetical protein
MKLNRDYIVLALCFLFLACGLALVVAVVSLSPSLGLFNATQVYVPEDIGIGCENCTIIPFFAGDANRSSLSTFILLGSLAVGLGLMNFT